MLEDWKKVQEKNERTTAVVDEACRTVLKLHILEEVSVEAKIRKLAVGVPDART